MDDEKVVDGLEVSNEAKERLWQKGWVSQWGGSAVGNGCLEMEIWVEFLVMPWSRGKGYWKGGGPTLGGRVMVTSSSRRVKLPRGWQGRGQR